MTKRSVLCSKNTGSAFAVHISRSIVLLLLFFFCCIEHVYLMAHIKTFASLIICGYGSSTFVKTVQINNFTSVKMLQFFLKINNLFSFQYYLPTRLVCVKYVNCWLDHVKTDGTVQLMTIRLSVGKIKTVTLLPRCFLI